MYTIGKLSLIFLESLPNKIPSHLHKNWNPQGATRAQGNFLIKHLISCESWFAMCLRWGPVMHHAGGPRRAGCLADPAGFPLSSSSSACMPSKERRECFVLCVQRARRHTCRWVCMYQFSISRVACGPGTHVTCTTFCISISSLNYACWRAAW